MVVNGTSLGNGALVNSTTPIRGNGIAKTRAFCLRLAVHEMFIVIIKANTIHARLALSIAIFANGSTNFSLAKLF